jgi:hypothetical protein
VNLVTVGRTEKAQSTAILVPTRKDVVCMAKKFLILLDTSKPINSLDG